MQRRDVVLMLAGAALATHRAAAETGLPRLEVFKDPNCGCCGAWVDHMRAAGFTVHVTNVDDTSAARKRLGMPDRLGGCHTATVGGYVLEGHVPSADVRKLLAAKPPALGLAVPGMPVGSPGMEVGARKDPYEVLLVARDGRTSVFARYPAS